MEGLDGFGCWRKKGRSRRTEERRVVSFRERERQGNGREGERDEPKEISTLEDLTTTVATSSRGMARRFAEEDELGEAGVMSVEGGAVKSLRGTKRTTKMIQHASSTLSTRANMKRLGTREETHMKTPSATPPNRLRMLLLLSSSRSINFLPILPF